MPRAVLALALLASLIMAGCAEDGTPFNPLDGGKAPTRDGEFRVPGLRVGDSYTYGFGFRVEGDPPFEISGKTVLEVAEATTHPDGLGRTRDALHIVQGTPGGNFQEHYWVDAATLKQFKLERADAYNATNRFTGGPFGEAPVGESTTYGNASGTLQRHLEDPLFEDFNFFGPFATGRVVNGGEPLTIDGNLWMRNEPVLLQDGEWSGTVEAVAAGDWGDGRRLSFAATFQDGDFSQRSTWTGVVSAEVPLVTEATRRIEADFGDFQIDVAFNVTLQAFTPGSGEPLVPQLAEAEVARRATDFADWDGVVPEGSDERLPFPLSEALAALELEPAARQFFTDHAGSYLRYGVMEETNTCGAYPAPPPGCHWYTWFGLFSAPDDYMMHFMVEKYADDSGGGVAVAPPVSRDYPFELVFDTLGGEPPEPPSAPVIVMKAEEDLPERGSFPADALTTSGAIRLWREAATSSNRALVPNLYFVFLEDGGYAHYVSHQDWIFPEKSLLFPLYDEGTLILDRHTVMLGANGQLLESRNFDVAVTHS